MEKFYEKKNLGIPTTILVILSYLIGYSLTRSLSGTLLVAVLFAGAVFSLEFDDRVKNAVKHAYIFAVYAQLIYILLDIFESLVNLVYGGRYTSGAYANMFFELNFLQKALNFLYTYGVIIINIAVIVIFGLFIVMSLLNKDLNLFCVKGVLGEGKAKPKKEQLVPPVSPVAPPPVAPVPPVAPQAPQASAPAPAPIPPVAPQAPQASAPAPAPVPPAAPQKPAGTCSNCGKVNSSQAKFCAACGSKL